MSLIRYIFFDGLLAAGFYVIIVFGLFTPNSFHYCTQSCMFKEGEEGTCVTCLSVHVYLGLGLCEQLSTALCLSIFSIDPLF